jgi:hypothetical protein
MPKKMKYRVKREFISGVFSGIIVTTKVDKPFKINKIYRKKSGNFLVLSCDKL